MSIVIDKRKVLETPIDHILDRINERYRTRMEPLTGEHYRFLTYIAWQFNGASFLDLGTRSGASALCLADNPSNKVTSMDISHQFKIANDFNFAGINNIKFIVDDVRNLTSPYFKDFDLIMIDLGHDGETEERILKQLDKINFQRVVIMDDIDYPKYKTLQTVWSNITRPKRILEYAHHSGTGIVSYGTEISYID